jgi:hypothetical protein
MTNEKVIYEENCYKPNIEIVTDAKINLNMDDVMRFLTELIVCNLNVSLLICFMYIHRHFFWCPTSFHFFNLLRKDTLSFKN